jgi:excisionase family DNA binding protein
MGAMGRDARSRRRTPSDERRRLLRLLFPEGADRPRFVAMRLLRAGEVATLLQVSRRSIAAWAQKGLIPFIETPGGHRRFRAADIRALVVSLERTANGGPAGATDGPAQ